MPLKQEAGETKYQIVHHKPIYNSMSYGNFITSLRWKRWEEEPKMMCFKKQYLQHGMPDSTTTSGDRRVVFSPKSVRAAGHKKKQMDSSYNIRKK